MAVALETLVKQLGDSGIIAQSKLEPFIPPQANPKDGEQLLRELYKQGLLTKFQAQQFAAGKVKSLVLGGYTILEKIGAGGMGQVFKAEHRRMKRIVAIKTLPAAMMKDTAAAARFQREVEAAAKLNHPNIVTAHDADEANGVHFLVMEFVEGQDLSALVKKNGPFPVSKAVNYILQAAKGLEFAHSEGIIHRDIKPANLLLDKKGTIKILDMGLARIESDGYAATQAELTGSGMVMGTVDYMAPEQGLNTKTADARADIYSLGCSLYYLISGKATYEGDTMAAKLLAHHTEPIPDLSKVQAEVPKQLQDVFNKMVAKKVEDRYQTMSEVITDLDRLVGNTSTVNDPVGATVTLDKVSLAAFQGINFSVTTAKTAATKQVAASKPTGGKQPPWKNVKILIGAGAMGLALLLGVILIVRDRDGKEVARIDATDGTKVTLPAGGSVQVQQDGSTATSTAKTFASKPKLFIHDPAFPAWVKSVQAMPAEEQVKAVSKKLMELNPGFDGTVLNSGMKGGAKSSNGIAFDIGIYADDVVDISPLLAFSRLSRLSCKGSRIGKGKLTDLSPLKGRDFDILNIGFTQVSDLSPLSGAAIRILNIDGTPISDLTPLKQGKNLAVLNASATKITEADVLEIRKVFPQCQITWDNQSTAPSPNTYAPPLAIAPFDAAQAKAHQKAWAKHLGIEVETPNSVGMKMVLIPPGEFMMGSTDEQVEAALKVAGEVNADQPTKDRIQKAERPQHKVVISKPFLMSSTEVTIGQFKKFSATGYVTEAEKAAGPPDVSRLQPKPIPTFFNPGYAVTDDSPAATITWNDAVAYCKWLSSLEKRIYRLPKEAEWEYACRAGTQTQYSFGDDYTELSKYGWYGKNAIGRSHPVATLFPNPYGLFDMYGNLSEWCSDKYDDKWYEIATTNDPISLSGNTNIVIRGGFWLSSESSCRSASRNHYAPSIRNGNIGFRCVAELDAQTAASQKPASASKLFMYAPAFSQWLAEVQAMPAEQQIEAVSKKLMELNPGFDGKLGANLENGVVRRLPLYTDNITDVSPIRAFQGLQVLLCKGQYVGWGKLVDLSPLKGMNITSLNCGNNPIVDLRPLEGMPLEILHCEDVPADFSCLPTLPLKELSCYFQPSLHTEILKSIKSLTKINGKSIAEFWADLPAEVQLEGIVKELREKNPKFKAWVSSKINRRKIVEVSFLGFNVSDLSPLRSLSDLTVLKCGGMSGYESPLKELSPLSELPLVELQLQYTQVTDLSPLQGLPLTHLVISTTPVSDLTPLVDCKSLTALDVRRTRTTQSAVGTLQKALPNCKIEWDDPSRPITPTK